MQVCEWTQMFLCTKLHRNSEFKFLRYSVLVIMAQCKYANANVSRYASAISNIIRLENQNTIYNLLQVVKCKYPKCSIAF